jgi:ubiquitin carboxyl-terminal hydrolase 4/11/15
VQKPNPSRFNQSNARGKKKPKPHKTYGKRAKRLGRQPQNRGQSSYYRQQTSTPDVDERNANDNGPLVRLHEGIVVDWDEEAWDEAYGGIIPEDLDGRPTFTNLQLLADEGLKKKQEQRSQRKKHGISLDDCLAEFEKEEILSEQDTWYCPRCKEHRRASKKFDLWKTPDILAVHLKRFSSAGWRREKLDVLVDFPIEGLDLTHRVIDKEDGRQEIYDLIAVDDHWGGLGGGHYTAFARNFIDGEWYSYNGKSSI